MNPTIVIKNNTGTDIPISILSNSAVDQGALNANKQFQWDLTFENFSGSTGVSIELRDGPTGTFVTYIFNHPVGTIADVVAALNSLDVGPFNSTSSGGHTFINTWNSRFEYRNLTIIGTPISIFSFTSLSLWLPTFKSGGSWHKYSDAQQRFIFAYYVECTQFYMRIDFYNGATFLFSSQVVQVNNKTADILTVLMTDPVAQGIDSFQVMISANGLSGFTQFAFTPPFPNWTLGSSGFIAGGAVNNGGFIFNSNTQQFFTFGFIGAQVQGASLDVGNAEILVTKSLFPAATDALVDINPVTSVLASPVLDLAATTFITNINVNLTGHTAGSPDIFFIYGFTQIKILDQDNNLLIDVLALMGVQGIGGVCFFNP